MKKTINKGHLVLVLILATCMVAVSQNQEASKKLRITTGNTFTVGVSTGMSPIKDYCNQHDVPISNPQIAKGSWALDISIFITDRLAYHLNGAACFGRQLSDLGNSNISMLGILASMGLEYYIPLGKNQLSAAIGIGGDSFGYFHDNAAARYDNLVLPISATFWHRRIGYSLAYEWCIGKSTKPRIIALFP